MYTEIDQYVPKVFSPTTLYFLFVKLPLGLWTVEIKNNYLGWPPWSPGLTLYDFFLWCYLLGVKSKSVHPIISTRMMI